MLILKIKSDVHNARCRMSIQWWVSLSLKNLEYPEDTSAEAVSSKGMKSTPGGQERSLGDTDSEKPKFPINKLKYNVGGLY